MKPAIRKSISEDQAIEIAVCFIISSLLILYLFSKPESDTMKAVVDDDAVKIRALIQVSKDLDEPGPCGQTRSFYTTPLIEAARIGRRDILLELLNAGANVNSRDTFGTSPLLAALSRGDVETSLALLKKGADPNLATCVGHGSCTTALRCARRLQHAQLIDRIQSVGGHEDTTFFFGLECFWMDIRPIMLFTLARIVPLAFFVMFSGSILRRTLRRSRCP